MIGQQRRLKAKPEALRARGLASPAGEAAARAEHGDGDGSIPRNPIAREHGTGDVARENAERIARIAAADALLGEAVGTATRAWTDIAHVVGASHPAAMGAQLTRENAERARVITKQLLRTLGRAL